MAVDTSRIMIKTFVKSALKDADEAPERCTRNLIDMALNFASKGSQQAFFQVARGMLNNENSPYYAMIENVLKHMDKDKLLNFGMNIGYNSCTRGANIIRQTENSRHFSIPWILSLEAGAFSEEVSTRYQTVIDQGKALGIYTYHFYLKESPEFLLNLVSANPDCAIIFFCRPELITEEFAEAACHLNNLLVAVEYGDNAETACLILRDHRMLYSLYCICSEDNSFAITSGSFFRFAEEHHSPFAAVIPAFSCSSQLQDEIYSLVLKSRNEQLYRTIPLDLSKDARHASSIISATPCVIGFNADGDLISDGKTITGTEANLFHKPLDKILQDFFPREIPHE